MAINKEDKADVKRNFGKALANKVADATRDHSGKLRKNKIKGDKSKKSYGYPQGSLAAKMAQKNDAEDRRKKNASRDYNSDGNRINRSGYHRGLDF